MTNRILIGLLAIGCLPTFAIAEPFPATFTLDPQTEFTVTLTTQFGHLGQNSDLTGSAGSLTATIDQDGILPPAQSFSDVFGTVILNDFHVGTVLGDFMGKGIQLQLLGAGPFPGDGSNPGMIDLTGLEGSVNAGTVTLGISVLANFTNSPIAFALPAVLAPFEESGGPPNYALGLTVPVLVQGTVYLDDFELEVNYAIEGSVVFSGTKIVPEPGAACLGAAALLSFVAVALGRPRRRCSHC